MNLDPTDGTGDDCHAEPDGRFQPPDRCEKPQRPAGDNQVAQILGLQNRRQGLSGFAPCALRGTDAFADVLRPDHPYPIVQTVPATTLGRTF